VVEAGKETRHQMVKDDEKVEMDLRRWLREEQIGERMELGKKMED
jgi:hypothetical protein